MAFVSARAVEFHLLKVPVRATCLCLALSLVPGLAVPNTLARNFLVNPVVLTVTSVPAVAVVPAPRSMARVPKPVAVGFKRATTVVSL